MSTSAGPWLANLVMDHAEDLATGLARSAQRQIPFYATWDARRVDHTIHLLYQALAQVFATGDMAPMRAYLERLVSTRPQPGGSTGSECIWLLERLEESLRPLIARQPADPRRLAEAQRLLRSAGRNARLIISEINLQTLTRSMARAR
jgi:hypothetical protein